MKRIWIAVALMGCGGGVSGSDPFEQVECNRPDAPQGATCARACAVNLSPAAPSCSARREDGTLFTCSETFAFEDTRGCCIQDLGQPGEVLFAECE